MTNPAKASLMVICPDNTPQWAENVLVNLTELGFQIFRTKPQARKLSLLNQPDMDGIICFRYEDILKLSKQRAQIAENKFQPLLILIENKHEKPTIEVAPDTIVFSITVPYWEHQLTFVLQIHRDRNLQFQESERLKLQLAKTAENLLRQERTTREVEILKNAIVRNVSHELKTPLLQVKSAVALLAEDVKDEKLITYAKGATARLETLVKNITMLGSSLDQNLSPVIVRDTIEYARRNLGRIWEHHDSNERVILNIQQNLPPVLADKHGLSTVLQLLMDNAFKFSKSPKDAIFVHVKEVDNKIRVLVKDEGIGIAQEQLSSIFESFYQIDNSSTRRYGGTGVGLAIVKLILDNHNTQINVESQVGLGTSFWFDLPIVQL